MLCFSSLLQQMMCLPETYRHVILKTFCNLVMQQRSVTWYIVEDIICTKKSETAPLQLFYIKPSCAGSHDKRSIDRSVCPSPEQMLAAHLSAKLQMLSVTTEHVFVLKMYICLDLIFSSGQENFMVTLEVLSGVTRRHLPLHVRLRQVAKHDVNMISTF